MVECQDAGCGPPVSPRVGSSPFFLYLKSQCFYLLKKLTPCYFESAFLFFYSFIWYYTHFDRVHIKNKDLPPWRNEAPKCRKSQCETLLFSGQDTSVFRSRHTSCYVSLLRTAEIPSLAIIHTINKTQNGGEKKATYQGP